MNCLIVIYLYKEICHITNAVIASTLCPWTLSCGCLVASNSVMERV